MAEPEIRELRYFCAVADEENITRAASRLGIAQPPLSRAIRQLERRLGVELFDRSGSRLTLTQAGEVLREEAAVVLGALHAAVRRTQRPELVVTAKPGVATRLLQRICSRFEASEIRVVMSGFGEQADMVRSGRADVAIAACVDGHGLEVESLAVEPRVAALAVGHALAARSVLGTADLRAEPAPRWSTRGVVDRDRPDGPVVQDSAQLLDVVALGQGVALVPASLAALNVRPDVTYVPVVDAEPYRTLVLWQAGSRSSRIARFIQTAHTVVN
ncbi:LysR family transcriptional regulator [Kibdelosporangium philippinense]|uniref:LysR family transcriptional regulator n=1 Tax=Kibdelosporangium philippinense TaxID=211113 RepID=A0ABS8ZQF0_9PSEU|nr:LysR family transcriptional regulator [Kibdelosporangium philippinense]MCE7009817.1 LysR family transcriptional regulator [Kibdelosporangium philippinense]